ncbi:MAG TPA: 30S ribosomal protein S16 [Limnochordales bacterium]
MAVRIRLKRMGAKKRPFYRLVVADSRAARDGRFIDQLGHYNPITEPAQIVVDVERALEWLRKGAQPSDTARALLKKAGVWEKFKPAQPEPAGQPAGEQAQA